MKLLARIRDDEQGVALAVAMGAVLVIGLLAFAFADTASRLSKSTTRSSAGTKSLSAAQAGVSVATHRLGALPAASRPADTDCYTSTVVPAVAGACPATAWTAWESLGNGTEMRYRISPVLSASNDTCAPQPVAIAYTYKHRCVTVETITDEQRRVVQRRIVQDRGAPLFPFVGVIGTDGIDLNQTALNGTAGSNGTIQVGPGSALNSNVVLGPAPQGRVQGQTVPAAQVTRLDAPIVLDPLDDFYSDALAPAANANSTLPPGTLGAGRNFSTGSNVTLQSGKDYSFCSLTLTGQANIIVPASVTEPVRIFVDSSYRTSGSNASGCTQRATSAGPVVNLNGQTNFINQTGKASMLQLFVYGRPSGPAGTNGYHIEFNGNTSFSGTLYAPNSRVHFASGGRITGSYAARTIRYDNTDVGFQPDPDAANVSGRWDGKYLRKAWRECRPAASCS